MACSFYRATLLTSLLLLASVELTAASRAATGARASWLFKAPPLVHAERLRQGRVVGEAWRSGEVSSPTEVVDEIERLIEKAAKDWGITGLSVGVIKDHSVIYSGAFGFADKVKGIAATDHTLFQIASNSKAFTSLLALQVVDEGLVDLDAPVRNVLPAFRLIADDTLHEQTQQLTLRDLMSHRTGLPRHDEAGFASRTRAELLDRLQYLPLDKAIRYNPGEYNNMMFTTAGAALESALSGMSWEDAVSKRIFEPLNMTRTWAGLGLVPERERLTSLSRPYENGAEVPYLNADVSAPAGAVVSNVADLLKWLQLHLRQSAAALGAHDVGQLLVNSSTYKQVLTGNTIFPLYSSFDQYSLGWWLSAAVPGYPFLVHGGNLNGFSSNIGFLPENGDAVVILTNEGGTFGRDALFLELVDLLTGSAPRAPGWTEIFKAEVAAAQAANDKRAEELQQKIQNTPPEGRVPRFQLAEYVGTYVSAGGYRDIHVRLSNSSGSMPRNGLGLEACGQFMGDLSEPWAVTCNPLAHAWYDTFLDNSSVPFCFSTDGYTHVATLGVLLEPKVKPIQFSKSGLAAVYIV